DGAQAMSDGSIAVLRCKTCPYLSVSQSGAVLAQLGESATPAGNKGSGIVVSNVTADAFKTMTFEATVRLSPTTAVVSSTDAESAATANKVNYILFSCSPGSSASAPNSTPTIDCACEMGVTSAGSLYFELRGYD